MLTNISIISKISLKIEDRYSYMYGIRNPQLHKLNKSHNTRKVKSPGSVVAYHEALS